MHLYCLTRGIKHDVDNFINQLTGQYFPYTYDPSLQKAAYVQFAVRPIQLWEFVFPEPCLQEVMQTIKPDTEYPKDEKMMFMLRKMLNASKIPSIDPKILGRPIYKNNIDITMIGTKKDYYVEKDEGIWKKGQEQL